MKKYKKVDWFYVFTRKNKKHSANINVVKKNIKWSIQVFQYFESKIDFQNCLTCIVYNWISQLTWLMDAEYKTIQSEIFLK